MRRRSWILCLPDASASDQGFMREALTLAQAAIGLASPNPCVGAVLVRNRTVVGPRHAHLRGSETCRGAGHRRRGGCRARGYAVHQSGAMFPSGRTGPCADAVIAAGVRAGGRGHRGPQPRRRGPGFARLRAAGVEVETGISARRSKAAERILRAWIRTGRPFVHLKVAMSLDAKIAPEPGSAGAPVDHLGDLRGRTRSDPAMRRTRS